MFLCSLWNPGSRAILSASLNSLPPIFQDQGKHLCSSRSFTTKQIFLCNISILPLMPYWMKRVKTVFMELHIIQICISILLGPPLCLTTKPTNISILQRTESLDRSLHQCLAWAWTQTYLPLITMLSSTLSCVLLAKFLQSCPTLCDPVDCNPPSFSLHVILQAGMLQWVAISFSRGSSWCRGWIWVFCITGRVFTFWATREALCLSGCKFLLICKYTLVSSAL